MVVQLIARISDEDRGDAEDSGVDLGRGLDGGRLFKFTVSFIIVVVVAVVSLANSSSKLPYKRRGLQRAKSGARATAATSAER